MVDLLSLEQDELAELLVNEYGEKKYRAKQIFSALHSGTPLEDISTLSKALRARIAESAYAHFPKIESKQVSRDGTVKYLFALRDGNCIESVVMKYKHGNTICISSQIGCAMGCVFCASCVGGRVRNLTPGELIGQIISAQKDTGERISNIVMMGIGEPLDNYDNVIKFIKLVSSPDGDGISRRHITLSTCGIVPRIYELAEEDLAINLAVSLHSSTDAERSRIMPVNRKYGLDILMKACRDYTEKTGRRITFEYAVIENVNSSSENAKQLAELMRGMISHVNLIGVNNVKEREYTSSADHVESFRKELVRLGINATVRRKLGADIDAACGQLRREFENSRGDTSEDSQ